MIKSYQHKILLGSAILIFSLNQFISGQPEKIEIKDSTKVDQKDIVDIVHLILDKQVRKENLKIKGSGPYFSILPAVGYAMHTGITAALVTSTSFYTAENKDKLSNVLASGFYSQYHQYWFNVNSNIFFEKHKLHLFGDTRYYNFPTETFGLGSKSSLSNPLSIDYSYLRVYQIVYREIASNLFVGIGYNLDYHWNIKVDSLKGRDLNQFIKFQKGFQSSSSGLSLNILYDSRRNAVNSENGTYASLQYRPNMTILGSDQNWQSLLIDVRHYIKLPASSRNVLCFWSYNDFTLSGTPPYLDMPSIGWDDYSNTGRGYAPGRYTGRNLVYLESEYRFSLTKNGLLGGVIFVNAESISKNILNKIPSPIPGGGFGLRIKINKYSNTNLAIDYGFGTGGSHGLFFNLGEIF